MDYGVAVPAPFGIASGGRPRRAPASVRQRRGAVHSGQATRARAGTKGRLLALTTAALLATGTGVAFLASAPVAKADPVERCTATTGAVVAVDFGPFGGGIERGCDTTPTTGYELLWSSGFTTAGTVHDGPGFLCRIGNAGFAGGTRFPTPATEPCDVTPQATAYWSYWTASPGQKKWKYSNYGAMARQLKPGDVDAWVFGATDIGGGNGGPDFTPDQVRAGGSGPAPEPSGPPVPQIPRAEVDLPAATRWLTGRLKDGERVVDEIDAYLSYQATAEDALALAATGADATAATVAGVLARPEHLGAYAYPDGTDRAPNSTAAARLALVAEATGGDPRSFGGRDLLADLAGNVCATGPTTPNCSTPGDFPVSGRAAGKAEGQALAVIALTGRGVTPPAEAVRRLTELQCDDGGFTSMLIRPGESCESEAGATGLAVMALLRAGGHPQAVADGRDYLRKAQSDMASGGLPAVYYAMVSSPYATGLAAQALRALGDTERADAAVSWLSGQQLPEGGFSFEEEDATARIVSTVPATVAGARTDLLRLTAEETTPPTFPTPTPTPGTPRPTTPKPTATTPKPTPTGPVMPSGPAPDLAKATAYLTDPARLLQGHYYASDPTGRADFGMTIDLVYALAATGTDDATLRGVVDFLDGRGEDAAGRTIGDYTGAGTTHPVGGALGKTALAAQSVGRDARDFGGQDLIRALAEETCAARTPESGRPCAAKGAYTNASSVFDQSLGVIAQLRAGETDAASVPTAYLKSLQRPSGAWGSLLAVRSGDEVDSTAMAAMAVDLLPDAASQAAVDKALVWLAGRQYADGGFPGASGNSVNSTALALQGLALDAPRYQAQIAKARAFLRARQNADGGFDTVAGDTQGSDVRASVQALGGTDGVSFAVLDRDLDGAAPRPTPTGTPHPSSSATAPVIITPGEDGGTGGGTGGTAAGGTGTVDGTATGRSG
ncbi:prenyltransferase/squalene oxidase repeat-containing protein, partial [Streptomyces sp. CBMA370]|uniref:prenyltransferase/squalene oxidase repeat-containing protein n=1 Tax=Streptomyces sp. CBMA370 TaxID=1930278 RepID=UPI002948BD94